MSTQFPRLAEVVDFVKEREAVRLKKEAGKPQPWSTNPALATYRFCAIDRNDDRVTKWIHINWLRPNAEDPYLWFAMVVARLFNLPFTLNAIGYPVPFKAAAMRLKLHALKNHGNNIFNAAYIVSTNGRAMDKVDYLFDYVLIPLWQKRKDITKAIEDVTLEELWNVLHSQNGLGSFMAAQVVADVKQSSPWRDVADWYTFAAPGPGSKRGLNKAMGRPADATWPGRSWHAALMALRKAILAKVPPDIGAKLCAQNVQSICCEVDKLFRIYDGEGKPKQLYKSYKGVM